MNSFRFRTHLIAYCTIITLLLSTALITLYSGLFRDHAIKSLTDYGKLITLNTSFSVADYLITENYAPLQEYVQQFSSRPGVDAINIVDSQWNILAASDVRLIGTHLAKDLPGNPLAKGMDGDLHVRIDDASEQLIITAPIAVGKTVLGGTRVYLSMKPILAHLYKMQLKAAFVGIAFWLLAVFIGSFLAQRMSEPVRRFMQVTDSISQGDFSVEIPSPRWVLELKRFSSALQVMAGTIASRELALQESEQKFRNLFERAMEGIFVANEKGELLDVNPALLSMLGGNSREAMLGRNLFDIFFENETAVSEFKKEITSRGFVKDYELTMTAGNDTRIIASLNCNIVLEPDGTLNKYEGMLRDISELENKEQQLRQAQKMESIGTLAGGLAHDFNNVLTSILGNLSLLQYKLKDPGKLSPTDMAKYLEQMETAGERAVNMVRQLLTLSRRRQSDLMPVDINLSLKHVLKIGESSFDKSVQVVEHPSAEPAYVLADPTEMEQVLLNLCINAVHAMTIMKGAPPWGGILGVSIQKIVPDPEFRKKHPEATDAPYWLISVSDTGVGMDTKTAAKIFDPFFTTKEHGKGTGLGLAMAYSIVRQLQGFIDVYSEPGLGSTFNVYLPLLRGAGGAVSVDKAPAISRGEGTVLVVDDDELVLDMAKEALQAIGYTVLTATNGREGVDLYRQHQDRIKAVLLDMAMPVMSGREAFIEMQKINPAVKVLLASGFLKDDRVEEILSLGVKNFLHKPYTIATLAPAIHKIIDS